MKKARHAAKSGEPSKRPDMCPAEKPASGIPKAVLQEPKLFDQKPVKGGHQLLELLIGAVYRDLLGAAAVQGQHSHQGTGIHPEPFISHIEPDGLLGGQCHKILNVPEGPELYQEFPHFHHPKSCTNN